MIGSRQFHIIYDNGYFCIIKCIGTSVNYACPAAIQSLRSGSFQDLVVTPLVNRAVTPKPWGRIHRSPMENYIVRLVNFLMWLVVCMYKLYLMTVKPGYKVISPRAVLLVKVSIEEQYNNDIHTDNN